MDTELAGSLNKLQEDIYVLGGKTSPLAIVTLESTYFYRIWTSSLHRCEGVSMTTRGLNCRQHLRV